VSSLGKEWRGRIHPVHETTQDAPGVIAFPPFIYGIPWLVGLGVHALIPARVLAPGPARAAGIVLTAVGIALAGWGRWAMRRVGTDPNPTKPSTALALGGPFRFTRNPLYLSLTLFYIGLTLLVNALWPLVLLPAVLIVVQRGVIEREERYLLRKFGAEYVAYRTRVRRWL
jgi:protein-S-isoprenylcysteine O-methyltransferase Ste14